MQGFVASCSKTELSLHTINGLLICTLSLFSVDAIHSMAFHEREWAKTGVLATGSNGTITLRSWNADDTPDGETAQWKWVMLHEYKCKKVEGGEVPAVTALKFVGYVLFSSFYATLITLTGNRCIRVIVLERYTHGTCLIRFMYIEKGWFYKYKIISFQVFVEFAVEFDRIE